MSPRNEDFLFAQEAQRRGYVTEAQLEEGFLLQRRMQDELQIEERLAVILVKRGWLAEEQARRVYARIEPSREKDEIQGYRIQEKLGRGAMGTVYKAEHLGLRRPVAIKILRRDLARDETQVERLKEEAKILGSLDHPNIVRALDAGESHGFPFVVMEFVEGETVKERMQREGALAEVAALGIARGIADALEKARRMGVVHRDVKPGNVILTRSGEPKLMDLGLAKGPVDLGLTQHGATVGTPQYISPEQAQDPRRADTRSDIYSLGATLYAMVTGRPPFSGKTLAEIITKVLYEVPAPPRVVNKAVSPEVSYLIERMMLKDPALRYRTPAEVVEDIDRILAGRSIIPEGFTGNWEAYLLRRKIRRWTKIGAVAAVVFLALGASGYALLRHRQHVAALEAGEQAIANALRETFLLPTDDVLAVQQHLLQAEAVLQRYEDVQPRGWWALENRAHALRQELRHFQDLEGIRKRVDELLAAKQYAMASTLLTQLADRIPGTDGPAERTVVNLQAKTRQGSREELLARRSEALRQPSRSFEELLDQQRGYRDGLSTGLIAEPDVRSAQTAAEQVVEALEQIDRHVATLEAAFSPAGLAEPLDALAFEDIRRGLDRERERVAGLARLAWEQAAADWIPWRVVRGHVDDRLQETDDAVHALIEAKGDGVMAKADALHEEGRGEDALSLLTRLGNAAKDAGVLGLRARASEKRESLRRELELALERAAEDLRILETDVLALLRQGRPDAIEGRVDQALETMPPRWPFRSQVQGMRALADAYRSLLTSALDGLEREGVSFDADGVRLADGTREARWTFVERVAGEAAVIVRLGRGGSPVRRELRDVHPDHLAAWATPEGGALSPLERAVALVLAFPDNEPEDLRPLAERSRRLAQAFSQARYEGGLAEAAIRRGRDVEDRQRDREDNARAHIQAAEFNIRREEYESALYYLSLLMQPGSPFRLTDAFDRKEGLIAQYWARAQAEVANKELALLFPGARLRTDGDRIVMEFDFQDPIQLESFRRREGRGWAVLEPYVSQRAVTPGGTDLRLHLLRGMEGLTRDLPLALPCIFDPAATIVVEFDLHTVGSPFFHVVDIDGLQVGILSADPNSRAYRERWRFPDDVPRLEEDEKPPRVSWYGRGRGVAFHAGNGLGDVTEWPWPAKGRGREHESWPRSKRLGKELFAFDPGEVYRVKVVRERGRLTLFVNDREVEAQERGDWAEIGRTSDRDRRVRGRGTGLLQILTWTPQAIDNLRISGVVLERYRER